MIDNQLSMTIESARAAAERGDFAAAVETQERVVAHMRVKAQSADDLVALSAQMFNLADYYTGVERFDDAIRLLEEVVALDERVECIGREADQDFVSGGVRGCVSCVGGVVDGREAANRR